MNSGERLALLGGNGSGKSTLLKVFSGYLTPTEGLIVWRMDQKPIAIQNIHTHISLCAPYQSPFPTFTLRENFEFYASFKKMQGDLSAIAFAEKIELSHAIDKPLSAFSSGMMQRVKLGLALLSDAPLLLLDEPTSHLDKNAVNWYHHLLLSASPNKTIVIATNEVEKEVPFETQNLFIQDYRA